MLNALNSICLENIYLRRWPSQTQHGASFQDLGDGKGTCALKARSSAAPMLKTRTYCNCISLHTFLVMIFLTTLDPVHSVEL